MDTAIARDIMAWRADPADNALAPGLDEPAFDAPLVGCACRLLPATEAT